MAVTIGFATVPAKSALSDFCAVVGWAPVVLGNEPPQVVDGRGDRSKSVHLGYGVASTKWPYLNKECCAATRRK
jgi:hypothetical protein